MTARGDIKIKLGEHELALAWTLGAIAEIERELKLKTLQEVHNVFREPSATALITVLGAAARAGGTPIDKAEIEKLDVYSVLPPILQLVAAQFSQADVDRARDLAAEHAGDAAEDEEKNHLAG